MPPPNFTEEAAVNGGSLRRLRRLITHNDLTAAANGTFQDLDHAEPLAGLAGQVVRQRLLKDALITAVHVRLDQAFSGGGTTAVYCTVGIAASPAAVMQSFDLFGSAPGPAVDGNRAGSWRVVPADALVIVRFSIDAAHNLLALNAGAVMLDVVYCPAPGRP